jgi:glycosyltransferase involved in cell wall biosynthesis
MIPLEKISYFPQHSKEIALHPQETSMNGDVDFMFMGNIGIAQDIQCILEAAERLKDIPNFKIHFVGEGSQLESSQRYVSDKQLSDIIIFHGQHPVDSMEKFYEMADACLLTLKADNITGQTMPSKLQGYMAAGKVVIGAINGAAQEVIEESQCGICVRASDSAALADAMLDFIRNPSKYQSCGENGRNYFNKHFTLETYIKNLEGEFIKLIEEKIKCSKTKH